MSPRSRSTKASPSLISSPNSATHRSLTRCNRAATRFRTGKPRSSSRSGLRSTGRRDTHRGAHAVWGTRAVSGRAGPAIAGQLDQPGAQRNLVS
jgi:hypothetical protein